MGATVDSFILKIGIQGEAEVTAATRAMQALEERTRAEMQALAGLGGSLDAAKAKLASMQAAASLGGGKSSSISGILAQREKIAGIEAKQATGGANVAKLQGALPSLKAKADVSEAKAAAEKLKETAESAKGTTASFKQLGAAAGETDGPLGNFVRMIGKFKAAGAAGAILALVGVLILVTTAAVSAAIALTRFALASADASRSARLLADAASGVEKGGEGLTSVIDDVAMKSPLAREKIAEMARAMEIAKLRGRDMQNALEATATATSAVGDSAGAAFKSIAEKSQFARRFLLSKADLEGTGVAFADVAASLAKAMGISVAAAQTLIQRGGVSVAAGLEAMNAAVQAKFGKTVAAQMLSLNVQFAKMKEAFAQLFEGIDLEPFLEGLKSITGMFSQNTVMGATLKVLFQSIFNPLAESAGKVFPIVEAFIQGMVIATLMMYLGFLKVKAAITEALGGDSASKIDWVKTAMYAGGIAVVAMVGAVAGLTIGIIALVTVMLPLAIVLSLPFLLAVAAIALVIYAFYKLYDAVAGIQAPDLSSFGMLAVQSIEDGILSKLASVGAAMKKVALAMLTALPNALIMHSPSVLLTNQSKMAVQSIVDPIEDGEEQAGKAMAKLGGGRPDFSGARSGGARGGGSRGGTTIEAGAFVFNVTSEDLAQKVKTVILDFFGQSADRSPEPTT